LWASKPTTAAGAVWTDRDLLLLEAFQIYEDSLCSGCGQSGFHVYEPRNTVKFDVETTVCVACESRETHQANHTDRVHGEKVYVVNDMR
jgi:uncharacterized cysteine cluster protein YcgN (CxxCxxCC family)